MASVKCPKCGNLINGVQAGQTVKCPKCGNIMKLAPPSAGTAEQKQVTTKKQRKAPFVTWKLVSGIISMVLFIFVVFQSCAAGTYNALMGNGEVSGSAGVIVAILMLAGGIVSVATRNSLGNGGNIALIVLFSLATLIGFLLAGSYSDLYIWSLWCLVNTVLAIIALTKNR